MAKIDITKTELVWPGKYNEDGTLNSQRTQGAEVRRFHLPGAQLAVAGIAVFAFL